MTRNLILALLAALSLGGCLSISSSDTTPPDLSRADCDGKEEQCRVTCGHAGVQSFSCTARPGEGFNYKCECRKPGVAL
jgi:hypothetical protein